MIEKTSQEFLADAEALLVGAAANDDFLKIKTPSGTAVLISEAEYQILLESLKVLIAYVGNKKRPHSPQKE